MSEEAQNPYAQVIKAHHERKSHAQAHGQRFQAAAQRLVNGWRVHELAPLINEFNTIADDSRLNLALQAAGNSFGSDDGSLPYIAYAVVQPRTGFVTDVALPTLRLTVGRDCMAHADVKRDNGGEFVFPLEGPLPTDEVRQLFAAVLRDALVTR